MALTDDVIPKCYLYSLVDVCLVLVLFSHYCRTEFLVMDKVAFLHSSVNHLRTSLCGKESVTLPPCSLGFLSCVPFKHEPQAKQQLLFVFFDCVN